MKTECEECKLKQPLISVIVPVYRAEAYLNKCISSIRNQTYRNLEIILVNDGSPDRSGEMCEQFAREDCRIRVFHKENGGQASARNMGLDHMTGDYVGFVDSDDWIELTMYEKLYNLLKENNAQISACGTQRDFAYGGISYYNKAYPAEKGVCLYTMEEALRASLDNQKITYSLCDKLFESSIFDGLRMTEGEIYEDMELIPQCLERAKRIVYDPQPLYHYFMTDQSTVRGTFNPKRFRELDIAWAKVEDYRIRYPNLYLPAYAGYVMSALQLIDLCEGMESCRDRQRKLIREMRKDIPKTVESYLNRNCKIKLMALRMGDLPFRILMKLNRVALKFR